MCIFLKTRWIQFRDGVLHYLQPGMQHEGARLGRGDEGGEGHLGGGPHPHTGHSLQPQSAKGIRNVSDLSLKL